MNDHLARGWYVARAIAAVNAQFSLCEQMTHYSALDSIAPASSVLPMQSIRIKARDLLIDDIVVDEDGTHEVTSIDPPFAGTSCMGVTMHGEEAFGEFVYDADDDVTVMYARGRKGL